MNDVVLIPGTLMPPSCFDMAAMPDGAPVTLLDWMDAVRPCGLEATASHVIAQLTAGTPTILVGHSTGGAIAGLAALSRPDLVAGLVLINSGPNMVGHGAVEGMLQRLTGTTDDALWEEFARKNVPAGSPAEWIHAMVEYSRRIGGGQAAANLADQATTDLLEWEALEELPVEVLHGALDAKRSVDDARAWSMVFPAARLTVLENCGHTPPLERPEAVAAAIERVARRICAAGR